MPTVSLAAPAPATIKLQVIETPTEQPVRVQDLAKETDKDNAKARGLARDLDPVERTWLVEGTKTEVAAMLSRLGAFAKDRNLVVHTGESVVVPKGGGETPAAAGERRAEQEPAGDSKNKRAEAPTGTPEPARTKLLLRFRLLRR
jgi:hypothetical protein